MKRKGLHSVLVVYKQTPRETLRIPAEAAEEHLRTLDHLYQSLQHRGIAFRAIPMEQLGPVGAVDLVITVGGDGTVLATSHFVTRQPILGIKSFGRTSVGHFCAATRKNLGTALAQIERGDRIPRRLHRLRAEINQHAIEELILNDCLFAHGSPAAISDYRLIIGRRTEVQRSSGVWISTAAGATAAIAGAGGLPVPLDSTQLQYRVREPYAPRRPYQLRGGLLPPRTRLRLQSLTPHGTFSIDGAHIQYPAPEGAVITVRSAHQPLAIYWR